MTNWKEDAMETVLNTADIIASLSAPISDSSESLSGNLQPKLDAMLAALEQFEDEGVFFAAFDDGRFYSLMSCGDGDGGPSCWSKYPEAEYTLGVVEPLWSEYLNIFKVVSGKIDLTQNRVTEFGVPDFANEEFNVIEKTWYGQTGWSAPFTCTLMHPDESEICEVFTVEGEDYSFGIQFVSEDPATVTSSTGKNGKNGKKGKNGKLGKSSKKNGKKSTDGSNKSVKASPKSSKKGKKRKNK